MQQFAWPGRALAAIAIVSCLAVAVIFFWRWPADTHPAHAHAPSVSPTPTATAAHQTVTPTPSGTPRPDPVTLNPRELYRLAHAPDPAAPPRRAEAAGFLRGEISRLWHMLAVHTGVEQCAQPCAGRNPLPEVASAALHNCKRLSPEANRANPLLDPARDGPVLEALITACATLRAAEQAYGAPMDSAAWRQALVTARDALAPHVQPSR